jgi:hypothetical protein
LDLPFLPKHRTAPLGRLAPHQVERADDLSTIVDAARVTAAITKQRPEVVDGSTILEYGTGILTVSRKPDNLLPVVERPGGGVGKTL